VRARRPEDVLSDEVRVALGTLPGVIVMRNHVTYGVRTGRTNPELFGLGEGTPDLMVIVCGRLLGLELKTPVGRLSKKQMAVREAWEAAGAAYRVARSVGEAKEAVLDAALLAVGAPPRAALLDALGAAVA
jgi:hypothetical protein